MTSSVAAAVCVSCRRSKDSEFWGSLLVPAVCAATRAVWCCSAQTSSEFGSQFRFLQCVQCSKACCALLCCAVQTCWLAAQEEVNAVAFDAGASRFMSHCTVVLRMQTCEPSTRSVGLLRVWCMAVYCTAEVGVTLVTFAHRTVINCLQGSHHATMLFCHPPMITLSSSNCSTTSSTGCLRVCLTQAKGHVATQFWSGGWFCRYGMYKALCSAFLHFIAACRSGCVVMRVWLCAPLLPVICL